MQGKNTVTLELLREPCLVAAPTDAAPPGTAPPDAAPPLAWLWIDEIVECDVETVAAKWGDASEYQHRIMAFQGITQLKITPWTAEGTRTLRYRLPKTPTSSPCSASTVRESGK